MRRSMRGVTIGILVVALSVVLTAPSHAQKLIKQGRYWVAEIENSFKVNPGGLLKMWEISGDVDVQTWDKNEVYIFEKRSMDVFTKEEAEEALKRVKVGYNKTGNTVEVDGSKFHRDWMDSSFEVKVPKEFNVDVATSGGDVSVGYLQGDVELKTAGGDVAVEEIVGDATLTTSGGDIEIEAVDGILKAKTAGGDITVERIGKKASLTTSGGDIELSGIGGEVEANTAGGDIILRDSKGSARVKTSGGDIELLNVGGEVVAKTAGGDILVRTSTGSVEANTSGGDIELIEIGGPVTASTAGGDIESKGVDGGVEVSTSGGDINLEDVRGFIEAKTAGGDIEGEITLTDFSKDHHVTIKTAGGCVALYIPKDLPATVNAVLKITDRAREDYNIYTDFPLKVTQEDGRDWGRHIDRVIIAKGDLNGGGDPIEIETTNGNIEIKKLRGQ